MTTITQLSPETVTTRAVDQIGDRAADEIDRIAQQLEDDAKAKAAQLRRFSASFREQTRKAAEDIAQFCAKAHDIFSTVEVLEARVAPPSDVDEVKQIASKPQALDAGTLLAKLGNGSKLEG